MMRDVAFSVHLSIALICGLSDLNGPRELSASELQAVGRDLPLGTAPTLGRQSSIKVLLENCGPGLCRRSWAGDPPCASRGNGSPLSGCAAAQLSMPGQSFPAIGIYGILESAPPTHSSPSPNNVGNPFVSTSPPPLAWLFSLCWVKHGLINSFDWQAQ